MTELAFVYNDGGRAAAGFRGTAGDCVTRSIAIATGKPYLEVYDAINKLAKTERRGKRKRGKSSARTGVYSKTTRRYLESIEWQWVPTMRVGSGCKVHLDADELPKGRLIVKLSKHLTAVVDHTIHDTSDPQWWTIITKSGVQTIVSRCVYGYYQPKSALA